MSPRVLPPALALVAALCLPALVAAQAAAPPRDSVAPGSLPVLPPATKLEAFKPSAGAVTIMGYTAMKSPSFTSVEAREIRDSQTGVVVRGVVVEARQPPYREERAFIDTDEVPELLKGIDALLDIQSNPTTLERFEARYRTRGDLEFVVFSGAPRLNYMLRVGRIGRVSVELNLKEVQQFRAALAAAHEVVTKSAAPR